MAASVLFKALAISCTERFVFASDFSLRKSACVQRATAPSGILKLEAFFLVESRLRLSRLATAAAGNFCLARALSWRISPLVQMRCLDDFFVLMIDLIFVPLALRRSNSAQDGLRIARPTIARHPNQDFRKPGA